MSLETGIRALIVNVPVPVNFIFLLFATYKFIPISLDVIVLLPTKSIITSVFSLLPTAPRPNINPEPL